MQSPPAAASSPTAPILSSVLSMGCTLLAIFLPAFSIYIVFTNLQVIVDSLHLQVPRTVESLSALQQVGIGLFATIPALCQAYGLLSVRRCFQSFVRGEYFTLESVKGLRGFAVGLFFSLIAALVSKPLLSFIATLNGGPGEREVSAGISSEQVLTLLFAGILWQIAGAMTSAKRLAEENAGFV
jgi:hypothetical protein